MTLRAGRRWAVVVGAVLCLPGTAGAAGDLSLADAVRRALAQNPGLRAAQAAADSAAARVGEARAPLLPRLDFEHRVARGDQPVYVFSSLLSEGRFREENFAIDSLNDPSPHTTHSTRLGAQLSLFGGGRNLLGLRLAEQGRDQQGEGLREARMATIAAAAGAYYAVQVAERDLATRQHALRTVEADLGRARARVDAGLTTEIDTLSLTVHQATLEEAAIRASNRLELARGELNLTLGEPLDTAWRLTSPLEAPGGRARPEREQVETDALAASPAVRQAELGLESARTERQRSKGSFLPSLAADAGYEWDRPSLGDAANGSWVAGMSLRLNLFGGGADLSRLEAASAGERLAEAQLERVRSEVRLGARSAWLEIEAAERRVAVFAAAVAQAEESHRLLAARYEAGLATVTDLLRSQDAALEAATRLLDARRGLRLAEIALDKVRGVLSPDSEVLSR